MHEAEREEHATIRGLITRIAPLTGLFLAAQAGSAVAQTPSDPTRLRWEVPTLLPPGALLAAVRDDPTAPGESTIEVVMPDGYRLPPHYHPSFEHVEVMKGTLLAGMGDQLDPAKTQPLATGDSATAPAGMHHFSIAKGRTVLRVTFMGPYTITYLRAEEAPHKKVFPFGY